MLPGHAAFGGRQHRPGRHGAAQVRHEEGRLAVRRASHPSMGEPRGWRNDAVPSLVLQTGTHGAGQKAVRPGRRDLLFAAQGF